MSDLFPSHLRAIELRDYQLDAIEQVRAHIRAGARNILLCAPTGSGKTVIGSYLINESRRKLRKSAFVVDMTALIRQTSETLDGYGIDHGIQQANHPRAKPWELTQVCSAQTIVKRRWPQADLLIIDEAHVVRKVVADRIVKRDVVTVGLSATPFTRGLGKIYDALVNVTTTNKLIEQGFLAPFRIYAAPEPDMSKVNTVAGEWIVSEASKKALEVVGDVVKEYTEHGEGRKFICSACDVAHVEALAAQFRGAGINVATYTYRDDDDARFATVTEFRKPDSEIRGLITVTAASKGFDVPDIGCVIMARPLRKSLAEHIQFFGRGLRIHPNKVDCVVLDHCIASGERVLTLRGLIPIEQVLLSDRLWDGHEWVSHNGVVYRGIRPVVRFAGLTATADHPVKTAHGWRSIGHCAEEQTPVVTTGIGGAAIRECENYFTPSSLAWAEGTTLHACALRMHWLWLSCCDRAFKLTRWTHERLSQLQPTASIPEMALCARAINARPMQQAHGERIRKVWREGDSIPLRFADYLRSLDRDELGDSGQSQRNGTGSHEQQRPLRTRQHSVDDKSTKYVKHAQKFTNKSAVSQVQDRASGDSICGRYAARFVEFWNVIRGNNSAISHSVNSTERHTWDIQDCGPRNSFTCEGLLVHNSGNSRRFWDEWQAFFETGCLELDDGKKREKAKKKDDENDNCMTCPVCKHMHAPRPVCPSCGHQYPRKKAIQHVAGTLQELVASGDRAQLSTLIWPQVVGHVRNTDKTGDADRMRRRALAIYKTMTGGWPKTDFEHTEVAPVSPQVAGKILQQNIAYARARGRGKVAA